MVEPGVTDLTAAGAPLLAAEEHEVAIVGRSPWYLAWRRLRRNSFALGSLAVFLLIVICCALAPVYASHIAHSGPNAVHAGESVRVSGNLKPVVSGGAVYDPKTNTFDVKPVVYLAPTWWHAGGRFVLGTDKLGHDEAVRLLYGGLHSLKIGVGSAFLRTFLALFLPPLLRPLGGRVHPGDFPVFALLLAFPVVLLPSALA